MAEKLIYTDVCNDKLVEEIRKSLGLDILLMYSQKDWNINDTLKLATMPEIDIVVINVINEMTLMEMSILSFLCKPILITSKDITEYPLVERTATYVDSQCDLRSVDSTFIKWYQMYRS